MSSSLISERSISGSISSMRRPVKCSAPIVARSEPEPLTHITSTSRPAWSVAVPLAEVLPPPKFDTARLAPSRFEATHELGEHVALRRILGGPEVVDGVDEWGDDAHRVISCRVSRSVAMRSA